MTLTLMGSMAGAVSTSSAEETEAACALPTVALSPTVLNFKKEAAGTVKFITIENPATGPNVPAGLGGHFIEEGGGKAEETNFAITTGGTCDIPGEVLTRGTSCTVAVKFVSGAANKSATYVLKYGNRLSQNLAKITLLVKSE
jgi:hypothetical protein